MADKKAAAPAEAANENIVEETIRDLKKISGFSSYLIINNDGIVIKFENMQMRTAVHYAHLVLSLAGKASRYVRDLFEAPDNEVESIRLRTAAYEMIIAQVSNFTMIVTQAKIDPAVAGAEAVQVPGAEGEKKEGEAAAEKKE
jgi:dynein light chain roadblock-type